MSDRNVRDVDAMAGDRIDSADRMTVRDAKPWVTGFLFLAAVALAVMFFVPWDRPPQTTSTPPASTESAPPTGTTGTAPSTPR